MRFEVYILSRITPSYLMFVNQGIILSPLKFNVGQVLSPKVRLCQYYCSAFERNNNTKAVE